MASFVMFCSDTIEIPAKKRFIVLRVVSAVWFTKFIAVIAENFIRIKILYLIVTIICEYKILRFWDCDDFAIINFCDFTKSS